MYIKRIILAIALIGLVAMGIFSYFVYNTLMVPNTAFQNDEAYVYIESDADYQDVYNQLKPLLKKPEKFTLVAEQKQYINNIHPGRYIITKGMNNNQIVNTLRSKNMPLPVIFNNQERLGDLAHRIDQQIEADSTSLIKVMTDSVFLAESGFTVNNALNMYIPNQYEFYWNTSAEEFRTRMLKEYHKFWDTTKLKKAKAIGLTPNQVQILASIVQEETAEVDERPRIAGVYMNRLQRGMKLQADPTVIYAIKKKSQNFDTIIRRVLYKDLEIKSPYNTYQHIGLPLGPIAMPDISSIKAVLNYENHDFLFFVANPKKPGYHSFAKTLRQHNRNKQVYVEWVNSLDIQR